MGEEERGRDETATRGRREGREEAREARGPDRKKLLALHFRPVAPDRGQLKA